MLLTQVLTDCNDRIFKGKNNLHTAIGHNDSAAAYRVSEIAFKYPAGMDRALAAEKFLPGSETFLNLLL
jgi:hypothetical protein